MKDVYRQCASAVVVRPGPEVLLVHKPRKRDAWQLPQGGVEAGETAEQAAVRELAEEAGVRAEPLKKSETAYEYDFPKSYRRFRPDNVCGQRVEFVFVRPLVADSEIRVDEHEIDDYAWVKPVDLAQYIKRKEYRALVEKLIQEGGSMV